MNTLGIIFLCIAGAFIIAALICSLVTNNPMWLILLLGTLFFGSMFFVVNYPYVSESDVANGKAEYMQETHVITNALGDTVNVYTTYYLKWKDGWEYGRKQKN